MYTWPRVALACSFVALAGGAMWLQWPWVVGFSMFFIVLVFS